MDRELVLAGLLVIGVTVTLLGVAPWCPDIAPRVSARTWERAAWRAIWWPSVPAVAVISLLIGWAIVEPATSDEPLPASALVLSSVLLGLWARALVRMMKSAGPRVPLVAGTVGLWRPRIFLSQDLASRLDDDACEAVRAHERAHVRHRDPLRILLAQFITDLQWPWPAARRRFDRWRHVLELARDEEARFDGIEGADLAAAVLVAATLRQPSPAGALLIDPSAALHDRIHRLLAPMPSDNDRFRHTPALLAVLPVALTGLMSGIRFGDGLVQTIVRWL